MKYRPEIDGLRTVAVVPVILFHAGFQLFSGGFVGVDIFFVISGYLITSIIVSDLEQGKFSLINFYERRARRILPALFFVLIACLPFAWMWLLPSDMKDFAKSLVAVSTFSSNILFWRETGYFATASELKPLLHTWSLAVEEQYYIFFPLFMMITWRFGRRWVLGLIAVAFVVSLGLGHWGALNKPDAAFFLLPTRAWELLVGVFAAFYLRDHLKFHHGLGRRIHQALSLLGFLMVTYSIFVFDEGTAFPGLPALVPTVGAGLIIMFASQGTWVNRLLSTKGFVGIGLISYSAYLWHNPLMVFARHRSFTEPSHWLMGVLFIVALIMAYISWRFVERPFRNKQAISRNLVFSGSAVMAASMIFLGLAGHATEGFVANWLERQPLSVRNSYQLIHTEKNGNNNDEVIRNINSDCRFATKTINSKIMEDLRHCRKMYGPGKVILGDSHGQDLFLEVLNSSKFPFIVGVTSGGCRPHTPKPECQYEDFLSLIRENKDLFSLVVYEQAGFYLLRKRNSPGSRRMFTSVPMDSEIENIFVDKENSLKTLKYLEKVSRYVDTIWFGPRIEPHIPEKYILKHGCSYPYQLRKGQRDVFEKLDEFLINITNASSIKFVSQNKLYDFDFNSDFMNCNELFWSDGDHLSASGEKYFSKRFNLKTLKKYVE